MCGIAGYFGTSTIDPTRLAYCAELMRRRGPDDEGLISRKGRNGRNLYLLHSRLSIIDLDRRARQPFELNEDVLCYNGEIYNYRELRRTLKQSGALFRTLSDTEVLAVQLRSAGVEGLSACEGMWAFAYFDDVREELHLSRDRFGEKPLFVFEGEGGVYFGSEPKFIFAMLGRQLPVNKNHIRRFLVNGYKALYKSAEGFFDGLEAINPGSVWTYGAQTRRETFFWAPDFEVQDDLVDFSVAVSETKEALVRSVELRMRADVPVAFLLSGGIDSNALISIAKRVFGYDVHGFTIVNTDARYEEKDMVEAAVRDLQITHTEVPIETANFLENLRTLVRYHDSPVSTITHYAQWRLLETIQRAGYKVSISGTGADELFSGYNDHHHAYLAAMETEDASRYHEASKEWLEVVAPFVRNPFLQDADYLVNNPEARDHIFLDSRKFSRLLTNGFVEPFKEGNYSNILLRNRMANELMHETVPVMLHEDDRNAMYFSIENRSPFLDTGVFKLAQSIPTRHLIRDGRAKAVLREAVRGIAPEAVLNNPRKVGFNAPLFGYLDMSDSSVVEHVLDDSPIFEIVKRDEIALLLHQGKLSNSESKFLFSFISSKMFLEEYSA